MVSLPKSVNNVHMFYSPVDADFCNTNLLLFYVEERLLLTKGLTNIYYLILALNTVCV